MAHGAASFAASPRQMEMTMHRSRPFSAAFFVALSFIAASHVSAQETASQQLPVQPSPQLATESKPLATAANIGLARDAVLPFVVSILVVREDFEGGEPKLSVSSGSGTVITPEGHVVTNAHVTDRGRSYRVVFGDGREREATLVGQDAASDLAVLLIKGESFPMPHARFAEHDDLAPGETVFAMGAPWGLSNSLSAGVVNNPRRLLVSLFDDEADYEDQIDNDLPTGRYYAWIQHDAAIAPGNSGGPLVDMDGDIVGVNTRGMLFGGNLAFAIPVGDVRSVVGQLIAKGNVPRSDLGLRLRSLRGSGESRGVLVNAVDRGGAAEKAGLKPSDRLLALGGVPLNAPQAVDVPAIQRRFAELIPTDPVDMLIVDGANERTVRITPIAMPTQRGEQAAFAPFGVSLQELTTAMTERRRLDVDHGLLVTTFRAGGPASTARPPIGAGAVLISANGKALRSLSDLDAVQRSSGPSEPVVVEFLAGGERRLSAIVPQWGDRTREPLPELPKAWVGVEVQPVPTSLATALGLPEAGFRITRVYPGSPLGKTGAKVGDLITRVGGEALPAVNDSRFELFAQRVREFEIGDTVVFDGMRDGRAISWSPQLARSPVPVSALRSIEVRRLRAQFREMGFSDRVERELALDQPGVLVQSVESGGAAGLAHLQAGDVVVQLGSTPIDQLDALGPALAAALRTSQRIPVSIIRQSGTRIVHLEATWIPESP